MKKVLVAALVIAGLAFSGCSKKAEEANTTVETNTTVEANTTAPVEANKTEANATEANKTH
jgi:outer membrane murein-binding lipoprotein Lpp